MVVSKESGYKNLEDLTGKKIGAGTETTGAKAAEENIKDAKVSSPGDYTVMFEALKTGALDAVVCDGQVAKNYVAANSNLEILGDPLVKEENQIIVKTATTSCSKRSTAPSPSSWLPMRPSSSKTSGRSRLSAPPREK